jgi:hypothetical protein
MTEKEKLFKELQNLDYNQSWKEFEKCIDQNKNFDNIDTFYKFQKLARVIWAETHEDFNEK